MCVAEGNRASIIYSKEICEQKENVAKPIIMKAIRYRLALEAILSVFFM